MSLIQKAGSNYGLALNWRKLELFPVRCDAVISKPDGGAVDSKDSIVYLGSLLSKTCAIGPELSRRLGAAKSDFATLAKVWGHSSLSMCKKLQIFDACITSKLLYCLHTSWLKAQKRAKLNDFQARCLRKIAGIPPSYESHVSNETVLQTCRRDRFSLVLHVRQLELFGRVARLPNEDIIRQTVFQPSSVDLKDVGGPRKRGRPRHVWSKQVYSLAVQAAGSADNLHDLLLQQPDGVWQTAVQQYRTHLH